MKRYRIASGILFVLLTVCLAGCAVPAAGTSVTAPAVQGSGTAATVSERLLSYVKQYNAFVAVEARIDDPAYAVDGSLVTITDSDGQFFTLELSGDGEVLRFVLLNGTPEQRAEAAYGDAKTLLAGDTSPAAQAHLAALQKQLQGLEAELTHLQANETTTAQAQGLSRQLNNLRSVLDLFSDSDQPQLLTRP